MNNVEQLLIKYIEIKTWKMIEGEIDPGKRGNCKQMFWRKNEKRISGFFVSAKKFQDDGIWRWFDALQCHVVRWTGITNFYLGFIINYVIKMIY